MPSTVTSRTATPGPAGRPSKPVITATSQQSRFHAATLDVANNPEVELSGVSIQIGENEVISDAELKLKTGERYGLLGRNGSGKSTLLQALADRLIPGLPPSLRVHLVSQIDEADEEETAQDGKMTVIEKVLNGHTERRRLIRERDVLARAVESTDPTESQRILDSLLLSRAQEELEEARRVALRRSGARGKEARAHEIKAEEDLEEAQKRMTDLVVADDTPIRAAEMLLQAQMDLEVIEGDASEMQANAILRGLGFKKSMISGPYLSLSGGWRSRCRLATALLVQVDLLILDEPTNFMDLEAVLWLENHLPTHPTYSTLLLTSHDQTFLDAICTTTIALRSGALTYFDGPPGLMMRTEAEGRVAAAKKVSALEKKKAHIQSSITEGRKTAKAKGDDNRARMAKSRQKKLDDRWGLEESAKGGRFKLNRDLGGFHLSKRAEIAVQEEEKGVKIRFPQPAEMRVKGALIHAERVSGGWGGKIILEGVGMTIQPGARISLVGAGKSTLAALLTGTLKPKTGSTTLHPSLRIGTFNQHTVEALAPFAALTALQHFRADVAARSAETVQEADARKFLGGLGLQGATASDVPIGMLSGGQKVRLGLALLMYRPPNLLVLDEVTTHLDLHTIRALARALKDWEGAILLVTHDRWFSSVVVEGEPVDEDAESASDASGSTDGRGSVGQTYMVEKGAVSVLEGGMGEYEAIVRKKVEKRDRRLAKGMAG